ncbi:MAG: glycosyltransferase [Marinirhabdus sp.]|nr:glycosyltransferase [Marinirhabdus sp.]
MSICLANGGAERSAAMLSEMLHSKGHEVHIAILTNQINFDYKGKLFNLGLEKRKDETLRGRLKRLMKLRVYLKKEEFDLIIDHRTKTDYYRERFYQNVIYRGFKKIYVVHSSNQALYLTKQPHKAAKIYNKNLATVGVSHYITQKALPEVGIKNTHTIANAFDQNWAGVESPVPEALHDQKYILSYGRIDDTVKDLTFLINSFTASNLWQSDVKLVVLGDGPDKEALQHFSKGLASSEFIMFLPNQSPFSIVKKATCVTLTSRFEGFPMVLVEALSLSVPVVSLDIVSGPSEIIEHGENGLLVEKREVSLFAEALQAMVQNQSLHNHCASNAKASVAKFSMAEISEKWNQLIQDEVR